MKVLNRIILIMLCVITFALPCSAFEGYDVDENDYEPLPLTVIPPDNRVAVGNTRIYPYNAICKMYIYLDCGCSVQGGTGFLISDSCIVTAAHNFVCNKKSDGTWHSDGKVSYINIYFGYFYDSNNVLKCSAKISNVVDDSDTDFYYSHYVNNRNADYDYGYITLDSAQAASIGNITQYFTLVSLSDSNLSNKAVTVTGFPTGTTLYTCDKNIQTTTSTRIYYDVDTSGGQSGSPIYYYENGTYKVIGIHTNGFSSSSAYQLNYGRRIDNTLLTLFNSVR